MVVESCCIIVILLFIVLVIFFLFTQNRGSVEKDSQQGGSIKNDSPPRPQPDYIPTYQCSNCGLNFVQPEEIDKYGSKILVCPDCKKEIN